MALLQIRGSSSSSSSIYFHYNLKHKCFCVDNSIENNGYCTLYGDAYAGDYSLCIQQQGVITLVTFQPMTD